MSMIAERRTLPRTGLSIPVLGLGGAALGGMHDPVSEAEGSGAIAAAWDAGIRYFDTAPLYGRRLGELRTGAALREHLQGNYVLSTKVGWRVHPLLKPDAEPRAGNLPFAISFDYSHDGTLRSVQDSLIRLGMDRLDLAFVHDVDPYNHGDDYRGRFAEVMDGTLPALMRLREEGVIGGIGAGVNDCGVCLDFLARADLDCILLAGRYSLLDQRAGARLLPECERRGVGVIIGAPFNTGLLAKGRSGHFNHSAAVPPDILARLDAIQSACAAHGVTAMAAALQFPLRHPAVVSILPGPRSREQVAGIAAATAETIPDALWPELEA